MNYLEDTIVAISTPVGFSGIGIVRMSGENSVEITKEIFKTKTKKDFDDYDNRSIIYGHIIDGSGEVIDEVLVSKMLGPNTYTKEDVIEINCHGGMISVRKILELIVEKGARIAEPGEFTKRAFLNGRLDLSQAEAVIDVINAKTEKSLQMSVKQLEGSLSYKVKTIRNQLIEILAYIEAGIDYPEYDIEEMSYEIIREKTNLIKESIDKMILSSESGKIIREGIKTAIVGKPNVGKSSLLNMLLGEERAIVTEIEGTTRDTIEEYISIKGIPLKIIDTAGIRETENIIEKIGITKTKEILAQSDFAILLLDGQRPLDAEDEMLLELAKDKKGIVAINKVEKNVIISKKEVEEKSHMEVVEISVIEELGIDNLRNKIYENITKSQIDSESYDMVSNIRHINLLKEASKSLEEGLEGIKANIPVEMLSVDIKNAWDKMGRITGETVADDIVDEIFSKFCIGK
ncbi:tRNA uridine-5-carboxymethylaminomethyl(34) synthesis GTPase MnmE [Alkalibacter mobilis]|uniref:tRNA uridine-5-carboxymethylaminomethyl(34) synthesis GTPase MnmE n=1 Tax=Alkalibacter mobilis TaxID=2787712 RepID=UPI00189F6B20|nr:tRNA uridine-5-carboxymethylaminomethyl(34) synthesis GTPase MnmE [Alkalibacter mobilis]MBF7096079.1 tRNA uridine-5-carboxymethylaminomethyl(34) synthesis GTPase MnmE [Alkalibacter mobilis]